MSRFLLTAVPFTGHVTPMRAIATELVARGHEVRFYSGQAFQRQVEATGAVFVPWRAASDFDENDLAATFPRLVGKKGFRQLMVNVEDVFIGTAAAQCDDLAAEWAREPWDAMAGDEMSIGTALFAERSGSPWATVAVLPLNLAGTGGPPSGLGLAPGRNPLTKARDAALRAAVPLLSRPLAKPLAAARAAAGLPPAAVTLDRAAFSERLVIASGSPELDYSRTDRPSTLHFVGELVVPSQTVDLPPWWHELEGRRVVHVTQGTQNIDPGDLIRPTLEALAEFDGLVVVTTGVRGRDELPFPVPANTRVAGFLSYAALLPLVHTMVTNGGWGGVMAGLAHGIPLVIAGGDLDKPEIASRVAWAGAGVNLRTGTPKPGVIAAAVARIDAEPALRASARRLGERLRGLGGAAAAAEMLEGIAA